MKFSRSIPYDILIRATPNHGFIVEVGCAKFVYTGYTQLIRDLTEYFENPEAVEMRYNMDIQKPSSIHIGTYGSLAREQLRGLDLSPGAVIHNDQEGATPAPHEGARII